MSDPAATDNLLPAADPIASPDDPEAIVLVDADDNDLGYAAKLPPHVSGTLHRAFSVFLFDRAGRTLLQRRADAKYHFGGRWSNACCSHPRKGQSPADAAGARLDFELGVRANLRPAFQFTYRATDPVSGLTEHELDHVFVARYEGPIRPNPDEVSEVRWETVEAVRRQMRESPEAFTPWFRSILDEFCSRPELTDFLRPI